jgi:hypothetical protein
LDCASDADSGALSNLVIGKIQGMAVVAAGCGRQFANSHDAITDNFSA